MKQSKPANSRRIIFRWLLVAAGVAVAGLAVATLQLKLHEDELVFRTAISRQRADLSPLSVGERVNIEAPDGQRLAGLLLRASPDHDSGYWILHLHGNADSAFSIPQQRHIEVLRKLGFSVLALDYRGFGLSPGTASETHLYEDATAAFDYLLKSGAPPERIVIWGHSLGGGPAVFLAARTHAAALVLFGAFTSIPNIAQDTYPYLPVKYLASMSMDSLGRLRDVHMPVLIAHSVEDIVVPFHHGQELFAAANAPKRFLTLHATNDRLGGHASAIYERPDLLAEALSALLEPR